MGRGPRDSAKPGCHGSRIRWNVSAAEPDFFWSPINTIEDIAADDQFHAAGGIADVTDCCTAIALQIIVELSR